MGLLKLLQTKRVTLAALSLSLGLHLGVLGLAGVLSGPSGQSSSAKPEPRNLSVHLTKSPEVKKEKPYEIPKVKENTKTLSAEPSKQVNPATSFNKTPSTAQQITTDKKVIHPPRLPSTFILKYPTAARRLGWEGRCRFLVDVDNQGNVTAIILDQSTGHDALDNSARKQILATRFIPALDGEQTIASRETVTLVFQLSEADF